jgi:hypothetical protein
MLDLNRIEKVRQQGDCYRGRCPACAEAGGDRQGHHLTIFKDGRFACAANQGDSDHRKAIFALVGIPQERPATLKPRPAEGSRRAKPHLVGLQREPTLRPKLIFPDPLPVDWRDMAEDAVQSLSFSQEALECVAAHLGLRQGTVKIEADNGHLGLVRYASYTSPAGKVSKLANNLLAYLYPEGLKVRHPYGQGSQCRFLWLYGRARLPWRYLPDYGHYIITEGETDALAALDAGLEENGSRIIASPGTSFQEAWAPLFRGATITLCTDADTAGQRAAERIVRLLRPYAQRIHTFNPSQLS